MSRVNISPNLFLGKAELTRLFGSHNGIDASKTIFKCIIDHYGIVRFDDDTNFTALQVVAGPTAGYVSIKPGKAIDANIEHILVASELVDFAAIPTTGTRYIVIKYVSTNEEGGTVQISSDGTIVGTGTRFTTTLRGMPDFPSKIKFPNATSNTNEYHVASVISDTQAVLSGFNFTNESGLKYIALGTFTPGITVSDTDKRIYSNDSYEISVRTSDSLIPGREFILAEVNYDGTTMQIVDRRLENILTLINSLNVEITDPTDAANLIVGFESSQYHNTRNPKDFNRVTVGWGLRSPNTQWEGDPSNNQITIYVASGGSWVDISPFSAGNFIGWRVYYPDGNYSTVTSSTLSAGNILITVDVYDNTYPVDGGTLTIVPNADFIRLEVNNTTNLKGNSVKLLDIKEGYGVLDVLANFTSIVSFSLLTQGLQSEKVPVGDGDYMNETSFNDNGVIVTPAFTSSTGGAISPVLNSENHHSSKAWIDKPNIFSKTQTLLIPEDPIIIDSDGILDISDLQGNNFRVPIANVSLKGLSDLPFREGTEISIIIFQATIFTTLQVKQNQSGLPSGTVPIQFTSTEETLTFSKDTVLRFQLHTVGLNKRWILTSTSETPRIQLAEMRLTAIESGWSVITHNSGSWSGNGGFTAVNSIFRYKVIGSIVHVSLSLQFNLTSAPSFDQIQFNDWIDNVIGIGNGAVAIAQNPVSNFILMFGMVTLTPNTITFSRWDLAITPVNGTYYLNINATF